MLLATIDVWESAAESRTCRVLVFEDSADLEIVGHGRPLLTMRFDCAEEGLRYAEDLRPRASAAGHRAA